jgi:hypothetical protein
MTAIVPRSLRSGSTGAAPRGAFFSSTMLFRATSRTAATCSARRVPRRSRVVSL